MASGISEKKGDRYGYDLDLTRPYHSRCHRIVSASARLKLKVGIEEAINGWARYRFDELQTAQEHYVKGSIERVKKEIAELGVKRKGLELELEALEKELNDQTSRYSGHKEPGTDAEGSLYSASSPSDAAA